MIDTLINRKFKTIQQDKLRGFATSFMANFIQDYFHNLKKSKEQVKRFKKMEGFQGVERNNLTKRAIIISNTDKENPTLTGAVSKKLRLT